MESLRTFVNEELDGFINKINDFNFLIPVKNDALNLKNKLLSNNLYVVFVGEFSSGKTSLINALFGLNLPVNILPETSSIWKIISVNKNDLQKTIVHFKNGNIKVVSTLEEINNIFIDKIKFIEQYVFCNFYKGITIVDTPGFSSLNAELKKILERFIREADVLLIAIDVNQGITTTTQEIIKKNLKDKRNTFVVLTKSDSKAPSSLKVLKKYIEENFSEFVSDIVITSSKKSNLEEIRNLLEKINKEKNNILIRSGIIELKRLCNKAKNLVNFQLENISLNCDDLLERQEQLTNKFYKMKKILKKEEEKTEEQIYKIINKAHESFTYYLNSKKKWIIEGAYSKNLDGGFEERFKKSLDKAKNEALTIIKKDFEKLIEELETTFSSVASNINIENSVLQLAEITVEMKKVIIDGIVFILSKIIKRDINYKQLEHLLDIIIQKMTKKIITKQLEEKINEVSFIFKNKLLDLVEENYKTLFSQIYYELHKTKDSYVKALNEINEQFKKKEEDIINYSSSLNTLLQELEKCGGTN